MDTWDDKTTGEKRSKILIHADRVQFLDPRKGDSGGPGDDDFAGAPASREPSGRRGGTASNRAPGGAGDPPRPGNGPSLPAAGPASHGDGAARDDAEIDDIPF
jgi:single-strand DNA-binding protein